MIFDALAAGMATAMMQPDVNTFVAPQTTSTPISAGNIISPLIEVNRSGKYNNYLIAGVALVAVVLYFRSK